MHKHNKIGWLVNDCLTCIPGTKTFWHTLLDWLPGLKDKTNGYTPYSVLADSIERDANVESADYILRNASYFRKIGVAKPTISVVQDVLKTSADRTTLLHVVRDSTVNVFNSEYTWNVYKDLLPPDLNHKIIPLGVDFNLFRKIEQEKDGSLLFIGAANNYPKGFDRVLSLIHTTEFKFTLVMKDDFAINHPRVKVYNRIGHDKLVKIVNSCSVLLCPSREETQHLAGIEAAACGLPLIVSNVGCYYNLSDGIWGKVVDFDNLDCVVGAVRSVLRNINDYDPRSYFIANYDLSVCKSKWLSLVNSI